MSNLKQKLDFVLQKIESARLAYSRHHIVRLVAVSKYSEVDKIMELYQCGQRAFGENKVQDLASKMQQLDVLPLQWHFIGNLQSNKINALLDLKPFLIHSVGSLELALALNQRAQAKDMVQKILLQVNASYEPQKGGVKPEECLEIGARIQEECQHLKLEGLMGMAAQTSDVNAIDRSFKIVKDLFDSLQGASVLSMGMSGDYEIAIANGANLIRVGSEIFRSYF